jgi:nucleotide-binding universal stress UspA family protein
MTQTFDRRQQWLADPSWAEPDKAIVVGVDGSDRSHAAVAWAITEATASGRPLTLLHVLDERNLPLALHGLESDQHAWGLLTRLESEARKSAPTLVIRKEMADGPVDTCLVSRSAEQSTLVVGRRGLGSFARLLVGSSSLSVASHARVPVVVVPDGWPVKAHRSDPVVAGVDHRDLQPGAIAFAFAEAQRLGVALVAAQGREVPALGWDPDTDAAAIEDEADHDSAGGLNRALQPFREAYPDVEVSLVHRRGHPLTVLLDEVGPTQLLVLGRHSDRRRGGFPFGSVARGVLQYAEVPVAIVPPRS